MPLYFKLSSLAVVGTLFFSACGDNLNSSSYATKVHPSYPIQYGNFIDAGVSGLEYTNSTTTPRMTEDGGRYRFTYGDILTFKVGNLLLGESVGLATITPKEIVSWQNLELNTSIYAPEVNNRVRLLLALDSDANPANGIEINATTRTSAQNWTTPLYDINETEFNAAIDTATKGDLNISSISATDASTHFESSLRCVYSGAYSGNWIFPDGNRDGFVGVMIQSNGTIVTLGDGQDLNGDGLYEEFLFARGTHYMDDGYYDFNETGEFNITSGSIVPSSKIVKGDGESESYNRVIGSFEQKNPDTNQTETGSYEASRVGNGTNVSYRYTGYGFNKPTGTEDPLTDPIVGLFTFDIDRNSTIVGLIHDARNNEEPALIGNIIFDDTNLSVIGNVDMNLTYKDGNTYRVSGPLKSDGTVNLDWYDVNNTKLGYIDGVGCQLQTHD